MHLVSVMVLVTIGLGLAIALAPPATTDVLILILAAIQMPALLGYTVWSIGILSALGVGAGRRLLAGFAILGIPWVNILICLGIARMAANALRRTGLPVGIMGVNGDAVVHHLSMPACSNCGYSLIGNISGVCPECGSAARSEQVG